MMTFFRKILIPVFLAGMWISFSEFFRNELLFKSFWVDHYRGMGLEFPSHPVNNALWGAWAFLFAALILIISKKFSLTHTTLLAWLAGFGLMWIVTGNMGVLPFQILYAAVPLSLLETFLAAWICQRMGDR
jgi:hypothetical protein